MAIADADYCFTYIDIGAFGKEGDSNVLKGSNIGQKIYSGYLNLPGPQPLENESQPTPYVFVADEAFALCQNVMRPYPRKNITFK